MQRVRSPSHDKIRGRLQGGAGWQAKARDVAAIPQLPPRDIDGRVATVVEFDELEVVVIPQLGWRVVADLADDNGPGHGDVRSGEV
jgi:hypothetical protein